MWTVCRVIPINKKNKQTSRMVFSSTILNLDPNAAQLICWSMAHPDLLCHFGSAAKAPQLPYSQLYAVRGPVTWNIKPWWVLEGPNKHWTCFDFFPFEQKKTSVPNIMGRWCDFSAPIWTVTSFWKYQWASLICASRNSSQETRCHWTSLCKRRKKRLDSWKFRMFSGVFQTNLPVTHCYTNWTIWTGVISK